MEAVIYSGIAGASSIVGILLVLRWRQWVLSHSHFVNSLAAGVIVGVAFVGLMPEAMEMCEHALAFVLAGFVAFYLVETVIVVHSGAEVHFHGDGREDHVHESHAWTAFAGLFLHSLVDGIVIGVGFEVSQSVGLMAAAGVILHELPEGATTFALLLNRLKPRTALWLSIAVGLATPVGAIVSVVVLPSMSKGVVGALLAVAAGSFVYVGASDLVPETHTKKGWVNAVFLVLGACLAFVMFELVHAH